MQLLFSFNMLPISDFAKRTTLLNKPISESLVLILNAMIIIYINLILNSRNHKTHDDFVHGSNNIVD